MGMMSNPTLDKGWALGLKLKLDLVIIQTFYSCLFVSVCLAVDFRWNSLFALIRGILGPMCTEMYWKRLFMPKEPMRFLWCSFSFPLLLWVVVQIGGVLGVYRSNCCCLFKRTYCLASPSMPEMQGRRGIQAVGLSENENAMRWGWWWWVEELCVNFNISRYQGHSHANFLFRI